MLGVGTRMESVPLVSIIIPVYNVENYLRWCIRSVELQTYQNIEVLLVDDGSTDLSSTICKQVSDSNRKFIYLQKTNGGLSSARNFGILRASGEYAFYLDGDDVIEPTCIENLMSIMRETGASVAVTNLCQVMNQDSFLFRKAEKPNAIDNVVVMGGSDALAHMLSFRDFTTSACGKIAPIEAWRRCVFPEGRVFEDLATIHTLIAEAEIVAVSCQHQYGQVLRKGSITRSGRLGDKALEDYFFAVQKCITYASTISPQCEEAAIARKAIEYSRIVGSAESFRKLNSENRNRIRKARSELKSILKSKDFNMLTKSNLLKIRLAAASPALFRLAHIFNELIKQRTAV